MWAIKTTILDADGNVRKRPDGTDAVTITPAQTEAHADERVAAINADISTQRAEKIEWPFDADRWEREIKWHTEVRYRAR